MAYVSSYPSPLDTTTCKATTYYDFGTAYAPWNAFDNTTSLTGDQDENCWSSNSVTTNQRLHVDLGVATTVVRVYYENHHSTGGNTTQGLRAFTLWGSNDSGAFAELTYATDTNWTQLTTDISEFAQHTAANTADPKYVVVTNSTPYRYYAFKIATNWGNGTLMAVRRIEMQYDDAPIATPTTTGHNTGAHWYYKKNRRRYNDQDSFKSNK